MQRRLWVLMGSVMAVMAAGAVVVVLARPTDYLVPLAGHLGAGRRSMPIEALLAAPAGLLLLTLFVALRSPQGGSEAAEERRRWSATFLTGVAVLFAALEGVEIGVIYGWFPVSELLPRLVLAAAAIWLVFSANSAAKLVVLGRADAPASPERLRLNRFGALVGLLIGAVLTPVSLWAPLQVVVTLWMIAPLTLALLFIGRAATVARP